MVGCTNQIPVTYTFDLTTPVNPPQARRNMGLASASLFLYVVGGKGTIDMFKSVHAYSLAPLLFACAWLDVSLTHHSSLVHLCAVLCCAAATCMSWTR